MQKTEYSFLTFIENIFIFLRTKPRATPLGAMEENLDFWLPHQLRSAFQPDLGSGDQ